MDCVTNTCSLPLPTNYTIPGVTNNSLKETFVNICQLNESKSNLLNYEDPFCEHKKFVKFPYYAKTDLLIIMINPANRNVIKIDLTSSRPTSYVSRHARFLQPKHSYYIITSMSSLTHQDKKLKWHL